MRGAAGCNAQLPTVGSGPRLPATARAAVLGLTLGALLAGCGYHVTGTEVALPSGINTLGIGEIDNFSREYGLDKTFAFALEREIRIRRQFRISADRGAADAILSATIRDLLVRPVAFDANDIAIQYEMAVTMDVSLTRQSDGQVVWQVNGLRETDEYSASSTVVVTSSSQFQQGTLDAVDVQNPQFNSIQLAETLRRQAIGRLIAQAVRDVYTQMVEDF